LSLTRKRSDNKRILFVEEFVISFGGGFAVSNVIDRFFLDNRLFTWSSYLPLVLIAIVSFWNVKRINKHAEKFAKELKK
jgi:hypothetical protein